MRRITLACSVMLLGAAIAAASVPPPWKVEDKPAGKPGEKPAGQPAAQPTEPAKPDTSKVFFVFEKANQSENVEKARAGLTGIVKESAFNDKTLGGLRGIVGTDPKTAAQDAAAAGAGSIFQVMVVSMPTDLTALRVTCTLFVPDRNSWKMCYSGPLATKGVVKGDMVTVQYSNLTDQFALILIAKLFPYKVIKAVDTPSGKIAVEVSFRNTSPHKVKKMTMDIPGKNLKSPVTAECTQVLAPGEEKTVTFELAGRPSTPLTWQQAVISKMEFEEQKAAPSVPSGAGQ